jgi:hypothetical protein
MIHNASVQAELEKLMDARALNEQNADRFLEELWSWFLGNDKALKQTAARILGRGYIGGSTKVIPPPAPFWVDGMDDEGAMRNLTGIG